MNNDVKCEDDEFLGKLRCNSILLRIMIWLGLKH